jgi:hypothetical protein
MNLPEPLSLEFNLFATAFFLVIAVIPQQALDVASLGKVKRLSPREIIGWRIFAGFFALMSTLMIVSQR